MAMSLALLVCLPEGGAVAQPKYTPFEIEKAALVFATTDVAQFTVSIAPAGFVFDETRTQYYPTIPSVTSAIVDDANWAAYAVAGGTCSSQDYTMIDDIGCGRYEVTITDGNASTYFTIDFTDAKWLTSDPDTYGIVCWLETTPSQILVYTTVGTREQIDQEDYGYFLVDNLRYWDMIRSTKDPSYLRDRDGFTLPTGNYPVGVNDATLDVNATITTTGGSGSYIVVGSGKTFRVTNDPWNWYSDPSGWYTTLSFEQSSGFYVNGGSLIATPATGMVYWEPASTTWAGMTVYTSATVDLRAGSISGSAGTGLSIGNSSSGNVHVEGYLVTSNTGTGVRVSGSDPTFDFCDFSSNIRSGAEVLPYSNALFDGCYFGANGIHGAVISGGAVLLQDCQVYNNGQHGVYLTGGSAAQVRVKGCRISDHLPNGYGIYMQDVSTSGFVELQNSCVYQNRVGIYMTGASILRGWHKTLPAGSECSEADVTGMNRISENDVNIQASGACVIDLGREYTPGGGSVCTLGGWNDIVSPNNAQVELDNGADASLVDCYWAADYSFNVNGGAVLDYSPELMGGSGACQEAAPSAIVEHLPDGLRELMALTGVVPQQGRSLISQIAAALRAQGVLESGENNTTGMPVEYIPLIVSPNPFSDATSFHFTISAGEQQLTLRVYDMLGRQVALIAQADYARGSHMLAFNAGALPAGMYTAVLHSATRVVSSTRFVVSR
jgi:hypothetical protein